MLIIPREAHPSLPLSMYVQKIVCEKLVEFQAKNKDGFFSSKQINV